MAHPPKKVTVTYNNETKKLNVIAIHPVKDVNDHYIKLISISVDDKEVMTIKPTKQDNNKSESVDVAVPEIVKGCKVTVKAVCNKFGSKTTSITIK